MMAAENYRRIIDGTLVGDEEVIPERGVGVYEDGAETGGRLATFRRKIPTLS